VQTRPVPACCRFLHTTVQNISANPDKKCRYPRMRIGASIFLHNPSLPAGQMNNETEEIIRPYKIGNADLDS
jgi:hypothetical protein